MSKLSTWLDRGLVWGAEYEGGLSSHLPMNLIALHALGADDDMCERFISAYSPRLQSVGESREIITDWRAHLGQHSNNAEYRAFFGREIRVRGRQDVLGQYLPRLAPGLSGGAFHPLIRLAFALEADHDGEVAEALASWCMAYQELGPLRTMGDQSAVHLLESIAQAHRQTPAVAVGDTLFDRMKSAATTTAFAVGNDRLAVDASTLGRLAECALAIYAGSNNGFLALHLVTATHAARRVLAHTACQEALLPALGQAFLAAYIVLGCPPIRSSPECSRLPGWDEILDRASASTNDHDAKLCFAMKDEQAVYGDVAYQREAARRMRLA